MALFRYDRGIVDRYPGIVGGMVHAEGVTNGPSSPELADAFAVEQRAVLERLGDTPLSAVPSLAAWRRAFRAFGVDPTAYRSAAEALLRRLTKQGSIPSINTLVDLGNLVSIRYGLPVAIFDLGSNCSPGRRPRGGSLSESEGTNLDHAQGRAFQARAPPLRCRPEA